MCFPTAVEAIDLSDYFDYTIIYTGNVTGYIDDNGEEKDSFEGCEYGRMLIIDYSKSITCQTYSYSYSYNPDIVILSNGSSSIAVINDDEYDIRL